MVSIERPEREREDEGGLSALDDIVPEKVHTTSSLDI